jgi:hypothetical protein
MCCDNVTPNSTDGVCDEIAVEKMCFRIIAHPTSVNAWHKQVDGGQKRRGEADRGLVMG